ncbi:DUF5325 family protein [Neobacillus notoginsengisoli]|uniref:DUF5325 family protein n=1 Tax=Neobacillus notoginsengisoli TaxID=1578198 RepID=UPI001314C438|nr:DUF5325 family protein [Neobacillus notoginsengisoli]
MRNIKWNVLGYAALAAASLSGIGIAIGEKSVIVFLLSLGLLAFSMRGGFKSKKLPGTK